MEFGLPDRSSPIGLACRDVRGRFVASSECGCEASLPSPSAEASTAFAVVVVVVETASDVVDGATGGRCATNSRKPFTLLASAACCVGETAAALVPVGGTRSGPSDAPAGAAPRTDSKVAATPAGPRSPPSAEFFGDGDARGDEKDATSRHAGPRITDEFIALARAECHPLDEMALVDCVTLMLLASEELVLSMVVRTTL